MLYRNVVMKMLKCKQIFFDDVTLRYSIAPFVRFQSKCSVSATGDREVRNVLCSKVRWGRKSTKF